MGTRVFDEPVDILQVVLAIGVNLQRVAEPQAGSLAQAGHDGAALALIDREPEQEHLVASCQLIQHGRTRRVAGVIHQYARHMTGEQRINHSADGGFVVVDRDDGAGVMHLQPRARSARWNRWRFHYDR
ncbi:hypothetical protein D3C78_872300 [compost metagenome]